MCEIRVFGTFWPPLVMPLGQSWYMSHGWKEDSMLVKRLAAYTHLSSTVSERYSKLLVENCDIFIPHLCLAAPQGWLRRNFAKILIYTKLEWMGNRAVKKACSAVLIQYQRVTDRRTDGHDDDDDETDVQIIAKTCIADARKKTHSETLKWLSMCRGDVKLYSLNNVNSS